MSKYLYTIIVVLSCSFNFSYSQENKKIYDDIYIYVDNSNFIGDVLGYKAYFDLKSRDSRFQSDVYHFKIDFKAVDYQSLYSLGKPINIESVNYINPKETFKNKSNCDLHTELSLYDMIFIITDMPKTKLSKEKDNSKRHLMWFVKYAGTIKDVIYTNMSGKTLLEN